MHVTCSTRRGINLLRYTKFTACAAVVSPLEFWGGLLLPPGLFHQFWFAYFAVGRPVVSRSTLRRRKTRVAVCKIPEAAVTHTYMHMYCHLTNTSTMACVRAYVPLGAHR